MAEVKEHLQVGVEQRLAEVHVFDAPMEDVQHRSHHLSEGTHLLLSQKASDHLLREFYHLLRLYMLKQETLASPVRDLRTTETYGRLHRRLE